MSDEIQQLITHSRLQDERNFSTWLVNYGESVIGPDGPRGTRPALWQRFGRHIRWNAADALDDLDYACTVISRAFDRAAYAFDRLGERIRWGKE